MKGTDILIVLVVIIIIIAFLASQEKMGSSPLQNPSNNRIFNWGISDSEGVKKSDSSKLSSSNTNNVGDNKDEESQEDQESYEDKLKKSIKLYRKMQKKFRQKKNIFKYHILDMDLPKMNGQILISLAGY
ncbi:hypothetical protein ACFL3E_01450 [Patescibacteria group bacterium]